MKYFIDKIRGKTSRGKKAKKIIPGPTGIVKPHLYISRNSL